MLYGALVFFVIAIIAAIFGFTGIAVGTASIGAMHRGAKEHLPMTGVPAWAS